MASITTSSSSLGAGLQEILDGEEIVPGSAPSYSLCKAVWLYHVMGDKIAASPIRLAQSQDREIKVPTGPEDLLVERFQKEWEALDASAILLNLKTQSRVYGLASVACGQVGKDSAAALDLERLWETDLYFNILDPLNTAGLIVDQNPNSPLFQKHGPLSVQGQVYHPSRTRTVLNEPSVYIAWTSSAYAYAGRSVYQRSLYPLKSFIETMRTDDMVARKAGLLVARMDQPGSVVDGIMSAVAALKRFLLRQGRTNDVLGISTTETIESLNLRNIDTAMNAARMNIIKNIATGAGDMPAKLLTQEAFVEGFGEGTEDAKLIAMYIDRIRAEMAPEYRWMDEICMRRAWSPEFYETVQKARPEQYGRVEYRTAFYSWRNSFNAVWPSLIKEPPSELAEVDDIRVKGLIAAFQVITPELDPENRADWVETTVQALNSLETLFPGAHFSVDHEKLLEYMETNPASETDLEAEEDAGPQRPFSGHDSRRQVVDIGGWLSQRARVSGRNRLEARMDAMERMVRSLAR